MKIQTVVATSKTKPLQIIEANLDEPKTNEVLVKMVASGVCHTDVVGHEGSGIVKKVGAGVTTVQRGFIFFILWSLSKLSKWSSWNVC